MVIMVSAPRRPINIMSVTTSLLASQRFGVMPVESPTVPKAEVTSKRSYISERWGSRIQSTKVPVQTTHRESSVIR